MAASTWFQTSACPPGNHGIMPEGNCHSAMWPAVSSTSSADRTPRTSGSGTGHLRHSGLPDGSGTGGVDHDALSHDGLQETLGEPRGPGPLGNVPHQETVI